MSDYKYPDDLIKKTLLVKDAYPESLTVFDKGYEGSRNQLIRKVYPDRDDRNVLVGHADAIRKSILKLLNHHTLKRSISEAYGDDRKFAKDAFTIYCFLSARDEERDPTYYKNCFCWVVRNIYKNPSSIIEATHPDVAFTMSIYGNLLKSDAFKYVPFLFGAGENEPRVGYLDDVPTPVDLSSKFTVEQSVVTFTQGGSSHSVDSLETFMNA